MLNLSKIVIFDIDGTLANTDHRVHHVRTIGKKNWGAFFAEAKNDKPHNHVVRLTQLYSDAAYHIILCTGRPANLREDTVSWLTEHDISFDTLLMRLTSDRGPDTKSKKQILLSFLGANSIELSQIEAVYEDRIPVAKMWCSLGLSVFLCGDEWREE